MSAKKLYTVKQVSLLLKISERTLWRWIREGRIKAIKLPSGRYRISEDELAKILGEGFTRVS